MHTQQSRPLRATFQRAASPTWAHLPVLVLKEGRERSLPGGPRLSASPSLAVRFRCPVSSVSPSSLRAGDGGTQRSARDWNPPALSTWGVGAGVEGTDEDLDGQEGSQPGTPRQRAGCKPSSLGLNCDKTKCFSRELNARRDLLGEAWTRYDEETQGPIHPESFLLGEHVSKRKRKQSLAFHSSAPDPVPWGDVYLGDRASLHPAPRVLCGRCVSKCHRRRHCWATSGICERLACGCWALARHLRCSVVI